MIRGLIICLFFPIWPVCAQDAISYCKQQAAIAQSEQLAHQRMISHRPQGMQETSQAGNNFVVHYDRCEWVVDPAVRYIQGKITLYYEIRAVSDSIQLDLINALQVDSVQQRAQLLPSHHLNNTLVIHLGTQTIGKIDSLSIVYKGVPGNSGFGSFIQSTHAGKPIIWSLSEPFGARDWWPCKNGLDEKVDSIDILITHPANYRAASNGLLQSEDLLPGGAFKRTYWKHRYPIATYLICLAVTNYARYDTAVWLNGVSVPMQTFCYPESLASFQNGTINTLHAMQLYSQHFGLYPFANEKYGHVQFGWGGGMEHQTSTFITSIDENLTAHELGHQWFGDKITCRSWKDIWLNEGFATHLASTYHENKYPATVINTRKLEIDNITSLPGGSVEVDDTTNASRVFDNRLTYLKGSHLLYMLRWKLGDSIFYEGMRHYLADTKVAYGFAMTEDFQRNMEEVSGQDLSQFFDEWFRGQGYPSYTVQWTPIGADYVKLQLSQTTSHTSVPFFHLPVPLLFKNATQEKLVVCDHQTNGQLYFESIGFIPDTVIVDPQYWLLTRNNSTVKIAAPNALQPTVQVFPNPVGDQFYLYLQSWKGGVAGVHIYNSIGQLVLQQTKQVVNNNGIYLLNSAALAKGNYFMVVSGSDGFLWKGRLVK